MIAAIMHIISEQWKGSVYSTRVANTESER